MSNPFIKTDLQKKSLSVSFGGELTALAKRPPVEIEDMRADVERMAVKLESRENMPVIHSINASAIGEAAGTSSMVISGADFLMGRDKASLTLGAVGNGVVVEAVRPGATENAITVEFVDPDAINQALSVGVVGTAITVSLATDGAGAITSTATLIANALNNTGNDAYKLVEASVEDAGATVQPAVGATNLSGGTGDGMLVYIGGNAVDVEAVSDTSITVVDGEASGIPADSSANVWVKSHTVSTHPITVILGF